ncbi:MAG: hypothetical protein ACTHNS_06865 [Marmoricola sp.]
MHARGAAGLLLRLLVVASLVADAVVHLRLAHGYQLAQPAGIGQGNLFRVEAVVALLVALWVLATGGRRSYVAAVVVAGSAFVAVVLYRYVDVPALGPVPSMYEPVWFGQKTLSAVAEGLGALLALLGATTTRER